jgi:hypothetical protein
MHSKRETCEPNLSSSMWENGKGLRRGGLPVIWFRVFSVGPHIEVNASCCNTSDVIIRFFCEKMYSSYDCLLTKIHNRFLFKFASLAYKNRNKWCAQPPELLCNIL